ERLLRQRDAAARPRRERVARLVDARLRAAGLAEGGPDEAAETAALLAGIRANIAETRAILGEPPATPAPATAPPADAAVPAPAPSADAPAADPAPAAAPPADAVAAAHPACASCGTAND